LRFYLATIFLLIYAQTFAENEFILSSNDNKQDSIVMLRQQSKNKNLSLKEQFSLAERARRLSLKSNIDSTIIKSNQRISSLHLKMKNYNLFKKINKETLVLAKKVKDSSSIAKAYFNLGNYFFKVLESDSAYFYYYNAEKVYTAINQRYNASRVLQNMAVVQQNEKDFIGSQETGVLAIKYLEPYLEIKKNAPINLSGIYNNLGITLKELEEYDKAIEYYELAYAILKKYDKSDKIREINNRNNIAMVYEKKNEYSKSLKLFSDLLLEKELINTNPTIYARILNNYARNKFLLNQKDPELPKLFLDALQIRKNIKDKGGVMRSNIDIAGYYITSGETQKSKSYAKEAYEIAKKYNRFDDQLETLLLLSKIEKGEQALLRTQEYIKLNDSLQKEERAIRNKFARIELETERIEEENAQISRERLLFLGLAIGLGIAAFLVYVIISQRAKNKELKFNQEQQQANEEIYNLMLSQQDKIDEGRAQEKKRISEDLHDGILGRLFGTRLSLDSLNFSTDAEAVKNRGQYIDELKSIEQEIRRISHDLNADFVAGSGYLDIVETLIETQTQAYQLSYKFIHKDEIDWEGVNNKTKIHFYRMIQESLQNIYKHANATHVNISFEVEQGKIKLNITDDGEGFIVNKAKKGIGLKNIKSRVDELKGELFIKRKNSIKYFDG